MKEKFNQKKTTRKEKQIKSKMFTSFRNFLSRHKRKFIVTGVVVGGGVIALRYAQKKLREFQETQAREFMEKARRSGHFESTERTCNQTIMSLAPSLCDFIQNALDTDAILEQIRQNPDNKLELWEELNILSFTRLTTLIYASSMLVVTLRVQLNLLGGYLYKDSSLTEQKISNEIQQTYLSLIQYFMKDGILELVKNIEEKVRKIMKNYNLKQKLTLADTEQIFWSIQMAVNSESNDPNNSLAKYVLPAEVNGNELLHKMFNETLDMIESDEVSQLSTNNISRGFSIAVDSIAEFYTDPTKKNGFTSRIVEISEPSTSKSDLNALFNVNIVEIPLAKLIPIINGLASKCFNNLSKPPSLSASLVTLFLLSDKVKLLGANVYEVFSQ